MLKMPWYHVFGAVLVGKAVKYGLVAAITTGAIPACRALWGRRDAPSRRASPPS
jgi:hypothetical protein